MEENTTHRAVAGQIVLRGVTAEDQENAVGLERGLVERLEPKGSPQSLDERYDAEPRWARSVPGSRARLRGSSVGRGPPGVATSTA